MSAAHGYAGIVAYTRGRRYSSGAIEPYEHDGDDAHDTIDWISKQPWSDGRVAMYGGGSYSGFTQWASDQKHLHPRPRRSCPTSRRSPGRGCRWRITSSSTQNYGWAFYVTDDRFDDNKVYFDRARWSGLADRWFASGRPYREIDRVDGTPNPLLQHWLAHPAYDAYWQALVPTAAELAKLDIPILTVTGYYDDGQISAGPATSPEHQSVSAEHAALSIDRAVRSLRRAAPREPLSYGVKCDRPGRPHRHGGHHVPLARPRAARRPDAGAAHRQGQLRGDGRE